MRERNSGRREKISIIIHQPSLRNHTMPNTNVSDAFYSCVLGKLNTAQTYHQLQCGFTVIPSLDPVCDRGIMAIFVGARRGRIHTVLHENCTVSALLGRSRSGVPLYPSPFSPSACVLYCPARLTTCLPAWSPADQFSHSEYTRQWLGRHISTIEKTVMKKR